MVGESAGIFNSMGIVAKLLAKDYSTPKQQRRVLGQACPASPERRGLREGPLLAQHRRFEGANGAAERCGPTWW
jgi:hypothetical protein